MDVVGKPQHSLGDQVANLHQWSGPQSIPTIGLQLLQPMVVIPTT